MDKSDVKNFIAWAEKSFNLPCLSKFLTAIPTAELEPITEAHVQSDEKVGFHTLFFFLVFSYRNNGA